VADISFERKKSLNRKEAAVWLTALARGFADGGEVELAFTWKIQQVHQYAASDETGDEPASGDDEDDEDEDEGWGDVR
jgi:hypothetical protein